MRIGIVNADDQRGVVVCIFSLFSLLLLVGFLGHVEFYLPEMRFEKPGKTLYAGVCRLRVGVSMWVRVRA